MVVWSVYKSKRAKKGKGKRAREPGMKAGHCWVDGWSLDSKWYPWGYEVTVQYPGGKPSPVIYDVKWRDFDGKASEASEAMVNKLIQKASAAKQRKGARLEAKDEVLEKSHPILHAFLTSREGEDAKTERKTSSLLIFTQDGHFSGSLTDREAESVLWASSTSLRGFFDELEQDLASSEPSWKPVKKWENRKGK